MRGFLLLLIIGLGIAAFFTKPGIEAHRARVKHLLELQQLSPPGEAGKVEGYRDLYVASQYRLESNGALVMDCWGALTQFVCMQPDKPAVSTESF